MLYAAFLVLTAPLLSDGPGWLAFDVRFAEEVSQRPNPRITTMTIFGKRWKVKIHGTSPDGGTHTVYVFQNGKLTFRERFELGGELKAEMCFFPTGFPVLAVRSHSFCGHGQRSFFYAYRDMRWQRVLETRGEHGGPIFRDMDQDGTVEWLIDDDDFYLYGGKPPKYILVYRDSGERLTLWRTLLNKTKRGLPKPFGSWWTP